MPGFSRTCVNCARTDRSTCKTCAPSEDGCADFVSWPDFYQREIAAVDRSLLMTWLTAILTMVGVAGLVKYLMP